MANDAQQTLSALRTKLAVRLGFAAQAANLPPGMQALLDSFLIDAHEALRVRLNWTGERRDWVMPLVPGQTMYPLPTDDCSRTPDVARIEQVALEVDTSWCNLPRGIEPALYTITDRMIPTRYDLAHGNANPDLQPPGLISPAPEVTP